MSPAPLGPQFAQQAVAFAGKIAGVLDVIAPESAAAETFSAVGSIAAPLAVLAAPYAALNLILGPSLSHVQCAPGNPDWPACATPGGSAAAISAGLQRGGLAPAEADARAQVVAAAAANGTLGGGAASRGSGPALSMR